MAATQVSKPSPSRGEVELTDANGTVTFPHGRVEVLGPHASLYIPLQEGPEGDEVRGEKLTHIHPARQYDEGRGIITYRGRNDKGDEIVLRVDTTKGGCVDCG